MMLGLRKAYVKLRLLLRPKVRMRPCLDQVAGMVPLRSLLSKLKNCNHARTLASMHTTDSENRCMTDGRLAGKNAYLCSMLYIPAAAAARMHARLAWLLVVCSQLCCLCDVSNRQAIVKTCSESLHGSGALQLVQGSSKDGDSRCMRMRSQVLQEKLAHCIPINAHEQLVGPA